MSRWRVFELGYLKRRVLQFLRDKKVYLQRYEKILMRWGSGLFWIYFLQCATGILLSSTYIFSFDTGLPTISFIWWETSHGSFLIRLHSEFGNFLFLFLYLHIFTKLWTSLLPSDADGYTSWFSGVVIFICTYLTGVTGAIIPCSTLGEVTATITGSAISSIVYIKFDFLETLLVPGMALNEESIWRTFVVHSLVPLCTFIIGISHMFLLHQNKYSAGGGFKRFGWSPRLRETRRWRYMNRYWNRPFGFWYRLLLLFLIFRNTCDLSWPGYMSIIYSFANFEYWPISETIDFVLAIPHWYLRPLMGALVTIPHHYLGFIYIGCFFLFIYLVPWACERGLDDIGGFCDVSEHSEYVTTRWDTTSSLICLTFVFGVFITVAIVPTGKYFVSLGSMDSLVTGYWTAVMYLVIFCWIGLYLLRFFFLGFDIIGCFK